MTFKIEQHILQKHKLQNKMYQLRWSLVPVIAFRCEKLPVHIKLTTQIDNYLPQKRRS